MTRYQRGIGAARDLIGPTGDPDQGLPPLIVTSPIALLYAQEGALERTVRAAENLKFAPSETKISS